MTAKSKPLLGNSERLVFAYHFSTNLSNPYPIISSISIWEIGLKAKRGHLVLRLPIAGYSEMLQMAARLEIAPVDVATWLRNLSLDWEHRVPADRTIVATATLLNCPLVTSDRVIRAYYRQSIW
jgi:PIN domain nuclease of toxin-antitoxin system